jgi:DNA polymerase-3 subunit delta'
MRLLGQGAELARVLAAARRLRLHHGLMVTGARGSGKSAAAIEIAQALACTSSDLERACGVCPACLKVASHNHADVHFVTVGEDRQDISVEQIRDLQAVLARRPVEGRARVVIIDPAERLTEQGQNALLKTLEEPGPNTFLLLPTARPEALLATVRSRADRLAVLALSAAQIAELLGQQGVGTAEEQSLAAHHAGGSLGAALELVRAGVSRLHQLLVGFLAAPNDISAIALSRELLAGTSDRQETDARARAVLALARSLLRESLHSSLASPHEHSYLAAAYDAWAATFDELFEAEADLDLRIAPEQVLSHAWLALRELRSSSRAPVARESSRH